MNADYACVKLKTLVSTVTRLLTRGSTRRRASFRGFVVARTPQGRRQGPLVPGHSTPCRPVQPGAPGLPPHAARAWAGPPETESPAGESEVVEKRGEGRGWGCRRVPRGGSWASRPGAPRRRRKVMDGDGRCSGAISPTGNGTATPAKHHGRPGTAPAALPQGPQGRSPVDTAWHRRGRDAWPCVVRTRPRHQVAGIAQLRGDPT